MPFFRCGSFGHVDGFVFSAGSGCKCDLRRYLEEVARRSDAEVQIELARLAYQREIFHEYSSRWWEQQNFERYWQAYYQGQEYAETLLSNASGSNACKLIRETPSIDLSNALLNQAFRRGMVSIAPDCFIPALLDQLKSTDRELVSLRARILELKRASIRNRPNPKDIEEIQDDLENELKKAVLSFAESQAGGLGSAVSVLPEDREAIRRSVGLISMKIDCENLRDRSGRRFSCGILEVPGLPVDATAVLRVLFDRQETGVYQEDFSFQRFFEAVDFYIREIRPGDALVMNEMSQLRQRLVLMDRTRGSRVSSFRIEFHKQFRKLVHRFASKNPVSERLQFSDETREQILERFFLLREKLLAYERVELGTRTERDLMNRMIRAYQEALAIASGIRNEFAVRSEPVVIQLDDSMQSRIRILDALPAIPGGILLGRDSAEADEWTGILELDEITENQE